MPACSARCGPEGTLDAPAEIEGIALETMVAQHLRALCQLRPGGAQLSFWRTRPSLEVDFVIYGPDLFLAVEVKRSRRVERSYLKALQAFGDDYPEAERQRLSFCPEPLLIDDIRCEPLETWLRRQLRPLAKTNPPVDSAQMHDSAR
jgi:hypothetical protein